ncbi:MAG: T9SS type A sorting domain-containing protein [Bacteroidetes bacterium]|jgi:hypothetical protein|nr:T9SS type A sorting domain-containing protein [Bacteroidota bacterium]
MRKVYVLSLIMFTMASAAFAQRTIDWSVDEIISPTQLNSSQSNQTPIEVDAVLKLVSGDSAFAGDTVGYQIVLRSTTDQLIAALPNGSVYVRELHKDMGVGDTMHLKRNITLNVGITASNNIKIQVMSILLNRTNPITPEVAPGNANNLGSKNIVWWNKQGWGVSVADVTLNDIVTIYPNPATDNVAIDWEITSGENNRTVTVYDINGRVVLNESVNADVFSQSLNVEGLEAGMYMVEVKNGEFTSTQKLQIMK